MQTKVNKHFVSDEDIFLAALRAQQPETASQQAERLHHEAIALRRDHAVAQDDSTLWSGFTQD